MICKNCGTQNPKGAVFCSFCYAKLEKEKKKKGLSDKKVNAGSISDRYAGLQTDDFVLKKTSDNADEESFNTSSSTEGYSSHSVFRDDNDDGSLSSGGFSSEDNHTGMIEDNDDDGSLTGGYVNEYPGAAFDDSESDGNNESVSQQDSVEKTIEPDLVSDISKEPEPELAELSSDMENVSVSSSVAEADEEEMKTSEDNKGTKGKKTPASRTKLSGDKTKTKKNADPASDRKETETPISEKKQAAKKAESKKKSTEILDGTKKTKKGKPAAELPDNSAPITNENNPAFAPKDNDSTAAEAVSPAEKEQNVSPAENKQVAEDLPPLIEKDTLVPDNNTDIIAGSDPANTEELLPKPTEEKKQNPIVMNISSKKTSSPATEEKGITELLRRPDPVIPTPNEEVYDKPPVIDSSNKDKKTKEKKKKDVKDNKKTPEKNAPDIKEKSVKHKEKTEKRTDIPKKEKPIHDNTDSDENTNTERSLSINSEFDKDYDGYYDDVLPYDFGDEGMNREFDKDKLKIVLLILGAGLIVIGVSVYMFLFG